MGPERGTGSTDRGQAPHRGRRDGDGPEASPPLLRIEGVRKIYRGGVVANDGVSLTIRSGEVFGLLGPNGAGKTTLVSQVIGLLKPDSGGIDLDGVDLVEDPAAARRLCSYLPQAQLPIDPMPVERAIELVGRIRGGPRGAVRKRRDELISTLELEAWRGELGSRVSGGVKRLVGFMMAAVWPGRLVILDEPTNDVDPLRRRLLWREIRKLAADGAAVLLVTHNVLEAERSVDRLAVIDEGRIIAEGTPASLKTETRGRLHLNLTLEPGAAVPKAPGFVQDAGPAGCHWLLQLEEDDAGRALEWARRLRSAGRIEEYELGPTTLEDTYVRLIGRADALEGARV